MLRAWDDKLLYEVGNNFQKDRQLHVSKLNFAGNPLGFGQSSRGTEYYHFFPFEEEYYLHNFLGEQEIFGEVKARFANHKAGDLKRCVTNMLSSQACCFNLFAPLKNNRLMLASRVVSRLLAKEVDVKHIIIEFTPNSHNDLLGFECAEDESIGDQGQFSGTDADVAMFYTHEDRKGVFLCEFKFIEEEFSICGSYHGAKKTTLRPICDSAGYYDKLIAPVLNNKSKETRCGYLKYHNWQLTRQSEVFDQKKIMDAEGCPFRNSSQQIWRNLLLVEHIAKARRLNEFYFGVISPKPNTYLWNNHGEDVENATRRILTDYGNSILKKIDLESDFILPLEEYVNDDWCKTWLNKFRRKYLDNMES
jgi:restriction endonuclease-like protein